MLEDDDDDGSSAGEPFRLPGATPSVCTAAFFLTFFFCYRENCPYMNLMEDFIQTKFIDG